MRWLVERKSSAFEDVGAEKVEVRDGCLVFRSSDVGTVYILAAGQWVTVVPSEDA